MSVSIHTISTVVDIWVCISLEDIRAAKIGDTELQMLCIHIIKRWPQNNDKIESSLGGHWPMANKAWSEAWQWKAIKWLYL